MFTGARVTYMTLKKSAKGGWYSTAKSKQFSGGGGGGGGDGRSAYVSFAYNANY